MAEFAPGNAALVGVGKAGTASAPALRVSVFGNKALSGVAGDCPEATAPEIDMFLDLSDLRLEEEMFFLKFSGADGALPRAREV